MISGRIRLPDFQSFTTLEVLPTFEQNVGGHGHGQSQKGTRTFCNTLGGRTKKRIASHEVCFVDGS